MIPKPSASVVLRVSIIASIVVLLGAFANDVRRQAKQPELPFGCDQFGYLRQARLFQERGWVGGLNTALENPQTIYLIEQAFASGGAPVLWAHGVAPHCHHYDERTRRVILQYPPGVGWLFSLFPEGVQARWTFAFAGFVVLALLIPLAAAARNPLGPPIAAIIGLLVFRAMLHFGIEYSIAASLAAAVLLGFLTVRAVAATGQARVVGYALLGLVFGLATTLRLPNLFCAVGPGVVLAAAFLARPQRSTFFAGSSFGLCALIGLAPVLIANAINAGHPLHTTYGAADASPPVLTLKAFGEGAAFYLYERATPAFFVWAGVAGLVALAAAACRDRATELQHAGAMGAIALAANLIYFVPHRPLIYYYMTFAAFYALSTAGFGLMMLANQTQPSLAGLSRGWTITLPAAAALIAIVVAAGTRRAGPDADWRLTAAIEREAIVWSDSRSGAFNYTLRRQASVLPFVLSVDLQNGLVKRIAADGIPQYLVADTANMSDIAVRLLGFARLVPVGDAFGDPVYRIEMLRP